MSKFLKKDKLNNEAGFIEGSNRAMDLNEVGKYMRGVASNHKVSSDSRSTLELREKVKKARLEIKSTHDFLLSMPEKVIHFVPSAEWIVDNYYIIEREAKLFEQSEKHTTVRLPVLLEGDFAGYPRIFVLARDIMISTGYHLDEDTIVTMVKAYQQVSPLKISELWALFDMIRAFLIISLNYVSKDIVEFINIKFKADRIMDGILDSGRNDDDLYLPFEKYLRKEDLIKPPFLTHIMYRLKETAIDDDILNHWIAGKLVENTDLYDTISREGQSQAKLQVIVGSLITSLREQSGLDIEKLFEKISVIDEVLQNDPSGFYSKMDFETRMDYHKKVEILAEKLKVEEINIAKEALNLSIRNKNKKNGFKKSHIGYYLLGKGLNHLNKKIGKKNQALEKLFANIGLWYFTGIIFSSIAIIISASLYTLRRVQSSGVALALLTAIVMVVPAITIAVEVVNFLTQKIVKPKKLPSMDFIEGIPDEYRSIVVMPVVLGSIDQIKRYIERIETYYFANKDKNLYFAIIGDLRDGDKRDLDDDKELLDYVVDEITKLNAKYSVGETRFYLFCRERRWNKKQNSWMGWERKRGILEDFNALILGEDRKSFKTFIGTKGLLKKIKFVITIDAGTELVRDSAKALIGIMAHPLNIPIINEKKKVVEDGYTIIQPRVGIRVASTLVTHFSRIFSGQAGIDTYTPVVSDVYQDVFSRGTFAGKGIYDPRIFHKTLSNEIPENTILSHDLLEGCFVQCAIATNVEFMDDFPSSLASFFMREHRWIRGDWQLLPWLLGKNPLSGLSKYKIADNLRRSLIPVNYLLLIFLAIALFSWSFWVWGTIVLFTTLFPLILHVSKTTVIGFDRYGSRFNIFNHLRNIILTFIQGLIWFTILPYRAYIAGDAIFRTLYRLYVSKKSMLEWKTAEAVEKTLTNSLSSYYKRMWFAPASAILLVLFTRKDFFTYSVIVGVFWFIAPLIGYLLGLSERKESEVLNQKEIQELRLISRKTWRYFDDFFTKEDNWLIPDNYQVWPENGIAHRTSTTNIGLELLCILSAGDFGYIGVLDLLNRIERIFNTLSKLEKWNGHFYNWYDTRSLQPLLPRYVSTVDSGNFIGCLIALKNGLIELKNKPILTTKIIQGIKDTAELAQIQIEEIPTMEVSSWNIALEKIKDKARSDEQGSIWSENLEKLCDSILEDITKFELEGGSSLSKASENNEHIQIALNRIDVLVKTIDEIISDTDFRQLFNQKRNQFRIGYNVSSGIPDKSYYDLLASEARLASFIAVAKGEVAKKHWFKLGRMLTLIKGRPTLVSWSGTMFEYLMPNMLMKLIRSTLLEQTAMGAVRQQINYGRKRNVPWGMSEAAYYRFDQHLNYQYRAIGVPDLGFSSELGKFLVVAPYATMLAIGIEPRASFENIELMKGLGAEGEYGFFEAIDYVSPDTNNYNKYNIVKSFFAHHQGMSLISLNNFINKGLIQNRFHIEPSIRATEIILEEKQPSYVVIRDTQKDITRKDVTRRVKKHSVYRTVKHTVTAYPVAHVLSNGRYSVMIGSTGSGYSWKDDIVLNRWRPDPTCDTYGQFIYIRDIGTLKYWSAAYQPSGIEPEDYHVTFLLDKAEVKRKDGEIATSTKITVSPHDNVEVRYVTLTNNSSNEVKLEVTSYMEAVIDKYNSDLSHPAFSKLFIETEYLEDKHTLIATRRPREKESERKFLFHTVLVDDKIAKVVEYETDRSKFIGRCNSLSRPDALTQELHLSNSVGRVLDTIMSLRVRLTIPAGKSRTVTYITGIADNRNECVRIAHEYRKPHAVSDTFKMALINSEVEMQYLEITPQQANAVQDIVGSLYYTSQLMRASEDILKNNRRGQSALWRFGISGDHPIVLLRINDASDLEAVKDVILAYEYLKLKRVKLDLVILNEQEEGYYQELSQRIKDLISGIKIFDTDPKCAGSFLLNTSSMEREEVTLLLSIARIVLTGNNRLLSKKVRNIILKQKNDKSFDKILAKDIGYEEGSLPVEETDFFNGVGGFSKDGREYIITLKEGQKTPNPWINVISSPVFGTNISESGSGYTWSLNSRENKITKWSNDPVSDPSSEAIYIRDEKTGKYFTTTALPIREKSDYRARHGFGYSVFEHNSNGIEQEMTIFVSQDDPIKVYKIKVKNSTKDIRKLSLTYFAELVLGVAKEDSAPFIITDYSFTDEVFTAVNTYNFDFADRTTFIFSNEKINSFSGDRSDFVGKGGCIETPQGMCIKDLSNKVGAGFDPCASFRVEVNLQPGQSKEVVFVLGEIDDVDKIKVLTDKYRNIDTVNNELCKVKKYWTDLLTQIRVSTPDKATNNFLNGWLLYQAIASRLMARGGFYQASGAIGFRDQLQDSLALLHSAPIITREIIIRHSSRQFIEGDVQHWWHPGLERGVRTKITDDLLWLPFVTAKYIETTGDESILNEMSKYLEDQELGKEEHDRYIVPRFSNITGSIYEHCVKALERSLKFGEHGLPLMGTGDWNDGMDRVGVKGKGESVWLSWLIYDILNKFAPICRLKGEAERADKYIKISVAIKENIEKNAWDGEWYLRAYFDDGTPLGSIKNVECQIDSISQAWAAISDGAQQDRAKTAMESVKRFLVKENDQIILLLTPPFDKMEPNPGYIRAYIPGIRENGGQYTHASVWTVIAFAKLGLGDTAYKLFKMLNPINHTLTHTEILKYKNEPYVMSADIYSTSPHNGRAGWSWYTGAAGWMYQAGIEWILGIKKYGEMLEIDPVIPKEWDTYSIIYRYKGSKYNITVNNPNGTDKGIAKVTVDGTELSDKFIHLVDDGNDHQVYVLMV